MAMNKSILMGRLVRDPEIRYSDTGSQCAVAKYTLAVNRRYKREGDPDADFIPCTAFRKQAEFADKYFRQGMRVIVSGRIQTGKYQNKNGMPVYSWGIIVEDQDFADSKPQNRQKTNPERTSPEDTVDENGFLNLPDGIDMDEPFH